MSKQLSKTADLQEIVLKLKQISPTSRTDMIFLLRNVLGQSLDKLIDTPNTDSVTFSFSSNEGACLLKAEYGLVNATAKEVDWYRAVQPYGFPAPACLASFTKKKYAFVLVKYIDDAETIDVLAQNNQINAKKLESYLIAALESDKLLFTQSKPTRPGALAVEKFFFDKYKMRQRESYEFPYLKDLFETPTLKVNDVSLHTPDYYLAQLKNDRPLHNYLTPEKVGLIHGDLHCGNILVKNDSLYCIDPNGDLQMPLEYDYGKLLHSIHGDYGSIMAGQYKLDKDSKGFYNFEIQIPEVYKAALATIQKQLTDQQFLRGLYAEAMHFATLLPHHATNQSETTTLYVRSVQLFDELFRRLDVR